ncbi:hypothetical protein [Marinifilum sp. D714]|uniref:hypothetical protein n=1 Tax=Marinifilum sp. D714 TaxID=2937523 RepID=UPI0027C46544|nr:hypothetical protein [Marinifilum sp. D714]MDQ2178001.1 hypothetical protein [Marinifilum sp. D714]
MKKETCLIKIQKRLPDDIIVVDETPFEFTDDEFICILSWIKYFNAHYKEYGKEKYPDVMFPIISKRLRLDFGIYRVPNKNEPYRGKYIIYLSQNGKRMDGTVKKNLTIKELVNTWHL